MSLSLNPRLVLLVGLLGGCGQQLVHYENALCSDGKKNAVETDVDCGGGTCDKCADGKTCLSGADCRSNVCFNGVCTTLPATCSNMKKDGTESDVDCGGNVCLACDDGKGCGTGSDCKSLVCTGGICQPANCMDATKNQDETDVDCGGAKCAKCDTGQGCKTMNDCKVGLCIDGKCAPASCADTLKNGHETDVDCGGDQCSACADGKMCGVAKDCRSGVCTGGVCQPATCMDVVKNQDETDVDCGGTKCGKCDTGKGCKTTSDCTMGLCIDGVCAPASCQDGLKDGDETDVDCGGSCPKCNPGKTCGGNADCASGVCLNGMCAAPSCTDTVKNGKETDVDCGGGQLSMCGGCDLGKQCLAGTDCKSNDCFNGICVPPNCSDQVKNAGETDVDCGGGACVGCADGKMCIIPRDCVSNVCGNGVCTKPTCTDKLKNGAETDVDCGGGTCNKCQDNQGCKVGGDCVNGLCVNSTCQPASCADKIKNGTETDVDCGGTCPSCGPAKGCTAPGDCWDNICMNGTCGSTGTATVGGNGQGAAMFDPMGDGSKLVVIDANGNVTVDRQSSLLNIARYIYVSNSGEGTVSKIDPNTQKEVARYCTAPGCNADPSRASVSLDGNVGVANRANYFYGGVQHPERASAVMIAGDIARCVDRNGNGKIDTMVGAGAVPQAFQWPANTTVSPDECVLWWTSLIRDRTGAYVGGAGTLPRSATFDSKSSPTGLLSSNFYVGLYGTSELVQIDASNGQIKQQVPVGGQPYSSVFDRFGILWIRDAATNQLIKVDTNKPNLPASFFGGAIPCGYAISADRRGYIYGGGGNCVARIDPQSANPAWESLVLPGACFPRGPSLDANYNLWVPDTCFGAFHVDASKPAGQGMVLKKAIPLVPNAFAYFLGTAIDGTGFPWVINTESNNLQQISGPLGTVYRIDYTNNYAVTQVRSGINPYVYSDLSGSQLALTAATTGSYRKTFQAFCGSKATWTTLTWADMVPAMTSVQVRYRAAKDTVALQNAPFVQVGTEPPAIPQPVNIALPQGTDPSFLQVEFVISTSDTSLKPTLSSVTVNYSCPTM